MRAFVRLVLLGLVLLVVAMTSAVITMSVALHGREVAVPDLTGKTAAEARKLAEKSGLAISIERQYYSAKVLEGQILSQVPPPEMKVKRGWEIRVAESLGPQRVEIPNVLGQSQHAAEMNIQRRGLDFGSVAQMQMPATQADRVLSQSPPPNASDVSLPKISLLVTAPSESPIFVMPGFLGQPVGSATQAVQDAGFRIGTVTVSMPQPDGSDVGTASQPSTVRPGAGSIIVSQIPSPGDKVTLGTTVSFQVR
jgi:beta-lactam-binding protein with PASTA domain